MFSTLGNDIKSVTDELCKIAIEKHDDSLLAEEIFNMMWHFHKVCKLNVKLTEALQTALGVGDKEFFNRYCPISLEADSEHNKEWYEYFKDYHYFDSDIVITEE